MKKSLIVAMVAVLCLILALSFTACGGGDGECKNHSYGDWTLVKSASCTDNGSEKRVCSNCQSEETRDVESPGHDWSDWNVISELTCTTDGKKTRTCNSCGETENDTKVHLGHDPVAILPEKAPSATEDGNSAGSKCSVCGEIFEDSLVYHKYANIAGKATFSCTGGNANFWAIDWNRALDGDYHTGTNSPKGANYMINMDYINPVYLDDFFIVCNGWGKYKPGAGETTTDTFNIKKLKIVLYSIEKIDEATGEPMFKEEFATELIDTSSLLSVKLSEYGYETVKKISRIAINIQEGGYNGVEYIYEIEVNGSSLITVCDNEGCDWSDWRVTKEATCSKTGLTNGEKTRSCSRCGKTESETIQAAHNWSEYMVYEEASCGTDGSKGRWCLNCDLDDELITIPMPYDHSFNEWYGENYSCTTGGTMTRTCQNEGCRYKEEKFAEPGKHVNVTVEGYVEPTMEQEGATGKATCDSCGTVIYENRVISKITNALEGATVSTTNGHWHVAAQNGTSGLTALIDGNKENGSASAPDNHYTYIYLELPEATDDMSKIILTVNGKGYIPAIWKTVTEVTNNNYRIRVNIYDENGEVIFETQEYNTLDIIDLEIDVTLPEGTSAKKIEIIRSSDTSNNFLWEVQALGGGKIIENEE